MKSSRLFSSRLVAAAILAFLGLSAGRAADDNNVTRIKFSDATKPGTLKVQVARGDVRIHGADTDEITVKSDARPAAKAPRKDGLRVLTSSTSYSLDEKDNVVTLNALGDGWAGAPAEYAITVPRSTSVVVQNTWGAGGVTCADVSGDLEINCMNGVVRLDGIAGSAVVSSMNGEIHASVRELHEGKPLSFTSMNGEIEVRVPADASASVRFRTQNGSILTDFDEKALVTKTENAGRMPRGKRTMAIRSGGSSDEIREAIQDAARASVEAIREAAEVTKEAVRAAHEAMSESDGAPMPPAPPPPPRPTISGGKLVSGTLNGGGPEIAVATMNGDVKFRKSEAATRAN